MYSVPISHDLRFNESVSEISVSKFVIYSGTMLLRALYFNTALFYFTLLSTESKFRSLNMREE